MTQEEKARAYDEALKRAKRMFSEKELNYLFPKLAESEDERIRKALLEYFGEECDTATINGIYCYKIYAWLEKQAQSTTITIPKDLKGTDPDGGIVGEQGEQPELKMPETPKGNYGSDFDIDEYRSLTHQLDYIIDSLRNLRYKMYTWELIDTKK